MPSTLTVNHRTSALPASARPGTEVTAFHRRLPGFAPTPLRELPQLATQLGVGRLLAKDESVRLGLPAFKVLGASWAVYRILVERLGHEPRWSDLGELGRAVVAELGPLRLVAATDGNHGRAVAHMARRLGLDATIVVPAGTAAARIEAIAGEGATVQVVDGTYDDAVAASAGLASPRDLVVSDTSWPGYEDAPRWVIEGYATIFTELQDQLAALDTVADVVLVPVGVGALAAAAAAGLRAGSQPGDGPVLIGVEPSNAACMAAAVAAGHVVEVPGPHRSIMAGLNCGLASMLALPVVEAAYAALVAVDDDVCRRAVRALADAGLDVGETGAAALAGLLALVEDHRVEVPLPATATAVLLITEGVTDPAGFAEVVGRPPR
ncbi:MAG: diaminopropionate ammonia-lyase [Acidimicrobiales bacterium]